MQKTISMCIINLPCKVPMLNLWTSWYINLDIHQCSNLNTQFFIVSQKYVCMYICIFSSNKKKTDQWSGLLCACGVPDSPSYYLPSYHPVLTIESTSAEHSREAMRWQEHPTPEWLCRISFVLTPSPHSNPQTDSLLSGWGPVCLNYSSPPIFLLLVQVNWCEWMLTLSATLLSPINSHLGQKGRGRWRRRFR